MINLWLSSMVHFHKERETGLACVHYHNLYLRSSQNVVVVCTKQWKK